MTLASACGFTERTTTCAFRAASAFEASARTPNVFVSSARRSRRGHVTVTREAGTRRRSSSPRIIASAIVPPPRNARRRMRAAIARA